MSSTETDVFDHALHTAHAWLAEVSRQLGTEDQHAAQRILRAWLHTLRDRLPVNAAADFAAQLPELFRGAFYDGWQPARTPAKYGPDEYRQRFAHDAQLPVEQVDDAAAAVTAALRARMTPGQIDHVLRLLAQPVRRLLQGPHRTETAGPAAKAAAGVPPAYGSDRERGAEARLAELEEQVANVAEAVRLLARGLEQLPTDRPDATRTSRAGSRAYELLIATAVKND